MTDDRLLDVPREPLALHVCCGPCSTAAIERLSEQYRVTAVWYNPNILPAEEHDRRLAAMRTVSARTGVPLVELECDVEAWETACAGLMDEPEGGARCLVCFRMRLERVARWGAEQGFGALTTTLSISPHKPAAAINAIGAQVAAAHGLRFLAVDLKQRDGFLRSVELSRRWGLYRQRYCGCTPPADA